MKTHDSTKLYQCPLCNRGFTSAAALTAHQVTHKHEMESLQSVHCVKCDKIFLSTIELQRHMMDHHCEGPASDKVVQCSYCGEICMGKKALDQHIESCHLNTQRNPCPVCQKNFLSYEALCNHLSVNHRDSPGFPTEVSPGKSKEMLVCPYCFSSDFDTLESLELHMQSVHNVRSTEVYTCNYCNAPYHNLYSLHEHMRAVHQNQPCMDIKYPCTLCSRHFSSIESLSIHKKVAHYKDKAGDKGSRTNSMSSDKEKNNKAKPDIRLDKTSERGVPSFLKKEPFEMVEIKVPSYPASHLRTPSSSSNHSFSSQNEQRPSPGAAFLSSSSDSRRTPSDTMSRSPSHSRSFDNQLSRSPSHSRTQHQDSITCDHCNATFYDIKNFQAHVNLHISSAMVQYTCKVCKQQFPTEEQLEKHTSSHFLSMATEYGCTTCMKLFSKPDELQKHLMDIHAHHLFRYDNFRIGSEVEVKEVDLG